MLLYLAIASSAFLAAVLVYRYDLYNREPWALLALAAALGAGAMRIAGELELRTLAVVGHGVWTSSAVAAVHEELGRLLVVAAVALLFPRHFDDPMDGIIYGSIAGLGMGVEESFVLLSTRGEASALILPVELVRLLGHLVLGGIGGFGLGMARMRMSGWRGALAGSVGLAMLLHFSWDVVALEAPAGAALPLGWSLLGCTIMLAGILSYGALVSLGARLSRAAFAPDSRRSLWGWPFRKT